jgi:dTDP-4-dehydrorhamnose reductase
MSDSQIIFTGGSGLLGAEFRQRHPDILYPSSSEFDVRQYEQMNRFVRQHACDVFVHAAAFTSPPLIDQDPLRALESNIVGTANVVKLCLEHNLRLVYISTDYVFPGDQGLYREEDPVQPVNKYAWSKLGGECAVRLYDNSLIIRTSFGPNIFPYDKAFTDQWTSRESVAEIAGKISPLIRSDVTGVIHVGGPRRTVFDYAAGLQGSKPVGKLSIKDVSFKVPVDTSLDCGKYRAFCDEQSTEKGDLK